MIVERVYASLLFVLLAVLGGTDCRADDPPASAIASVGGVEFEIEVAHTPSDRARGLSNRDSLPQMAGMLFVFESGEASSFWMKEMRFPAGLHLDRSRLQGGRYHGRRPSPRGGVAGLSAANVRVGCPRRVHTGGQRR